MIHSSHSEQGARSYQEDRFFTMTGPEGTTIGIADGHGGHWTASQVVKELPGTFQDALGDSPNDPEKAMRIAIAHIVGITSNNNDGCTLSLVFIPLDQSKAYIAILGDSPVIVRDKDGQDSISPEHNVRTNKAERSAAEARGGTCDGYYLFNGWSSQGLQMSRALGDRSLGRVLSREPEIYTVALGPGSFILVGTDGLLDPSHKDHTAAANITKLVAEGASAQMLCNYAVDIPTEDNVTAILWRYSGPQKGEVKSVKGDGLGVGDRVTWSSQSQASRTTKEGIIAAVIPAGQKPDQTAFPKLYKGAGPGSSRNHESYIVVVGNKPYWPRVKHLKKVGG